MSKILVTGQSRLMPKTTQNIPNPNRFSAAKYSFYCRKICVTLLGVNKCIPCTWGIYSAIGRAAFTA
jgi:hypothetical protein